MRVVIIGLVFAAVILAGGTAYLLRDYISAQQAEFAAMAPKAPTIKILVASANMPIGAAVTKENTQWVDWPEDGIQDSYLLESKDSKIQATLKKEHYIARRALSKGEPITMTRLYKSSDPGYLRGVLSSGMRAIAVRSGAENAAAGFILPGDSVDVMLTHSMLNTAMQRAGPAAIKKFKGGMIHTSETILENVKVLAIDQSVDEFKAGAQIAKTILLEVSPKDAEKLQTAKVMGKLSLVLRAVRGADKDDRKLKYTTDVEVSPLLSNFDKVLSGGQGQTTLAPRAQAPVQTRAPRPVYVAPAAPAPKKKQLSIYRGTAEPATAAGSAPQ